MRATPCPRHNSAESRQGTLAAKAGAGFLSREDIMRARILGVLAAGVCLAACGGSDNANIGGDDGGDSGTSGDGASGDAKGGGADSGDAGTGNDSSGGDSAGGDGGTSDAKVACDGGLTSCGGQCVDTKTDPNNCGGCGDVCSGGKCANGVCNLVGGSCDGGVPAVGDFACIGVDSQNVYVATGRAANSGGEIYKIPLAGGCPQTIVPNQANPHGVVSDGTNVYWAANGSGEIWKSDTSGANAAAIVTGQNGPLHIAVDANGVYWDNQGNQNAAPGSVWRADKSGANAKQLYSGLTAFHVGYLAVDAKSVYFPDPLVGTVFSVDKTGAGAAMPLATGQGRPTGVAVDSNSLYWTNQGGGQVMKLDLKPNAMPSALATGQSGPTGLATDGIAAYWANPSVSMQVSSGQITKVPVGGGGTTLLASMQNYPDCVAVDATSVYWIDTGGGIASKTAK
jgi:hypothetical protein